MICKKCEVLEHTCFSSRQLICEQHTKIELLSKSNEEQSLELARLESDLKTLSDAVALAVRHSSSHIDGERQYTLEEVYKGMPGVCNCKTDDRLLVCLAANYSLLLCRICGVKKP